MIRKLTIGELCKEDFNIATTFTLIVFYLMPS